ncbi:translocation/assembly module TamB domain-containing protein [Maliponia aquimaris]|uniref:Translocation and assembly module TamB n=1 Tax=Maliponia aquimaris TaxID=1673631 RepID=A0A238KGE7_9RHOB|nr:translocation/assembly module TamB domain-containing protein [Maliponia aquimaris]SMX41840.1 Translocation and assembly module TamB [Maliponia aquimaris]
MRFLRLLLVLLVWPLAGFAQDDDRGYIQGLLEDALSDAGREVSIEGFAGALSSRATIDRITVADDDGVWLTMTGVAMTWTRGSLLRGAVEIDEISVDRIEVPRLPVTVASDAPPAPEARSAFALPELPVSLRLAQLDLREVALGAPVATEDLVLRVTGNAQLSGGEGDADLQVERLDRGGLLKLSGAYSNTSRVLRLDTLFQEPAGGLVARKLGLPGDPSVLLSVTGDAPVDDFAADLKLETDGVERLAGRIVLRADGDAETQRLSLDIGGDLAPVVAPAYGEFLGNDIRLKAEAVQRSDGSIELENLDLRAQALELTGYAALAPDGWPQRLDLSGRIVPPTGDEVLLPVPGAQTYIKGATLSGTFDAARGNGWQLTLDARGLTTAEGSADRLQLQGSGEIDRAATRVTGALTLSGTGLAPVDAALAQALGETLNGSLRFDWQPDAPFNLRDMDLSGADYGLTGGLSLFGTGSLNPVLSPDLKVAAQDLSRFAGLAGIALEGGAELAVTGELGLVTGGFDLVLNGTTRDLATGIAQLDPLIDGEGRLDLRAVRDESGLRAERLSLITPQARITGTGTLATGASSGKLQASILETGLVLPGLSGATTAVVSADQAGDTWTLDAEAVVAEAGRLSYRGTVDLGGEVPQVAGRLDAALSTLAPFSTLAGRDLAGSVDLRVTGEGRIDGAAFNLSAEGQVQDVQLGLPDVDPLLAGRTALTLAAARTLNGPIRLDPLDLQGAVQLRYVGTVTPGGLRGLSVDGALTARVPSLALLAGLAKRPLSGAAEIEAQARGGLLEGALTLSGTLRGQNVALGLAQVDPLLAGTTRLDVQLERESSGAYRIDDLTLDGVVDARFAGRVNPAGERGPEVTGQLSASAASLTPLSGLAGMPLRGAAQIEAQADGALLDGPLTLTASVRGQGLGLGRPDIDPLLAGDTRLNVQLARNEVGVYQVDELVLAGPADVRFVGTVTPDGLRGPEVDGQLTASVASLTPFSGLAGMSLRGAAQLEAQASGGVLDGPLTLTALVRGQGLGIGLPTVDPLLTGNTQLDVNIAREEGGAYRIDALSLDASGIDADISGRYAAESGAELALDLRLANLASIVSELSGPASVTGTARQTGSGWQVDLRGSGPAGIGATVSGTTATDFRTLDLNLNGSAPLSLANGYITPQVVTGLLSFDIALRGAPSLGAVSGTVSTSGARFAAPAQNIVLNDLGGEMRLSGGQAQASFAANLGNGGRVELSGPVALTPPFASDLVLQLRDAVLQQAGLFETTASGRVEVKGALTGGASIGGVIDLGTVEARIPNIGASYAALDGLRHVGMPQDVQLTLKFAGLDKTEAQRAAPLPPYPLDLVIRAENKIFVRGRGLDAELGGRLRLSGTSADVVPIGQFDLIRGRLDLLGRRLELTEGSVALRGSFDPVIRFVATTRVEDTDITITIEGPASSPELTVGSVPELPQDEALSFFLFGKSVTNLSALQAVQLANAVRTLSGRGGLGLTDSLRGGLGVSDLDIGTADDGTAQARVGTYIGENIYSDVTVNAKGESEINLNLTVNPSVTVRGRLSSDGSSGIGVYFERDY